MDTGEVLDRTFYLYRKHFPLFVGICALPQLFQLTFQILARVMHWTPSGRINSPGALGGRLAFQLVGLLVMLLMIAISQAATTLAVSSVHLDQQTGVIDTYRRVAGKIARVTVMMVLVGIGVGCGLILLIVPGILLALAWSLCIPAMVIENQSIGGAISRSRRLTFGNRGRIFVVYVLFTVLTWIFLMLWEVPLIAMVGFTNIARQAAIPTWFVVAMSVGTFVTQSLVGPLLTIAIALIYYDARVRKEAFDLQHMMAAVSRAQQGATSLP
jgi:hypothetical protein